MVCAERCHAGHEVEPDPEPVREFFWCVFILFIIHLLFFLQSDLFSVAYLCYSIVIIGFGLTFSFSSL